MGYYCIRSYESDHQDDSNNPSEADGMIEVMSEYLQISWSTL